MMFRFKFYPSIVSFIYTHKMIAQILIIGFRVVASIKYLENHWKILSFGDQFCE